MNDPKQDGGPRDPRRPYQPPAVEDSTVFETLALTCGKLPGDEICAYRPGGYSNS